MHFATSGSLPNARTFPFYWTAKHNTKTCQRQHLQPPRGGAPPVTPAGCPPRQRETAFARGTRSHRSAFAIKLQAISHECHSERSEESLIISGTDLISTARDVSPSLNMTARFPTIGLSFFLLTAFLQHFYFCQIVSRIAVVRVDPQGRFEFFYRLGNSTHQCQSSSQITVGVGRIRIHAQDLLIMVDCL